MTKRSFLFSAACGLLASVALSAPSQAATVTTNILYGPSSPTTTFDLTYTGVGTITGISGFGGFGINGVTGPIDATVTKLSADEIEVKFASPITLAAGSFTFQSSESLAYLDIHAKVSPGSPLATLSFSTVPEPTSMALLGIGMTSFLAFRRFFKRTTAA
jgi:hypothetical protein